MPVTLLGSTFTRRDAICAVARAFDVTPEEALALTSKLLDRDSVVRVLADPAAGTDHVRTRSGQIDPRHKRRPALHHHRAPGGRGAHHRFGDSAHRRRNRPGRPRHRRPRPRTPPPSRYRTGRRGPGAAHLGQRLRPGDRPGRNGQVDHARCRPGRLGRGGPQGHRHGRGGQNRRRARGGHRYPELVAHPAPFRSARSRWTHLPPRGGRR